MLHNYTKFRFLKRKTYYEVYIYYTKNKEEFNHKTGVKIDLKHVVEKKGEKTISPKHPDFNQDVTYLNLEKDKLDNIIKEYYLEHREKPTVDFLNLKLKTLKEKKQSVHTELLKHYEDFVAYKLTDLRKGSKAINVYNSLFDCLNQYKEVRSITEIKYVMIDKAFVNDFINFMINEKVDKRNSKKGIGLNNNTVRKRLDNFLEFLRYVAIEKSVNINLAKIEDDIKKAIKSHGVKKYVSYKVTLTVDELKEFYHFPVAEKNQKYKDLFLFQCFQGMHLVDCFNIRKEYIRNENGQEYIIKDRNKTKNEFRVILLKESKQILEKYNYDLFVTEQLYNEELKNIMTTFFNAYKKRYEKKHGVEYNLYHHDIKKKGLKDEIKTEHKGKLISSATGRRTFATIQAQFTSLENVAKMMGHSSTLTTKIYDHNAVELQPLNINLNIQA